MEREIRAKRKMGFARRPVPKLEETARFIILVLRKVEIFRSSGMNGSGTTNSFLFCAIVLSCGGVSVNAIDPVFETKMMDMLKQTRRYADEREVDGEGRGGCSRVFRRFST